jgi:two-component system, OmpR family, sensor histidine kinase SenX3
MRFGREEKKESTEISPVFFNVLSQLDQDALLVAPGEVVRFSTEGIETLNLLKDNRITSPELVAPLAKDFES